MIRYRGARRIGGAHETVSTDRADPGALAYIIWMSGTATRRWIAARADATGVARRIGDAIADTHGQGARQ